MEKITVRQIMNLNQDGYQVRVVCWYNDFENMVDELHTVPDWEMFADYPVKEIAHQAGKMLIVIDCDDPWRVYAEKTFQECISDEEWDEIKKTLCVSHPEDFAELKAKHDLEKELWKARCDYYKWYTKYYRLIVEKEETEK